MSIQAIETYYKGYRFRSRLEARWAVFFDNMGIEWEYEKEGYELGSGLRYLPDFWLPKFKVFWEIKGDVPTGEEKEKAQRLSCLIDYPVIICVSMPCNSTRFFIQTGNDKIVYLVVTFLAWLMKANDHENAINQAKTARFEFGEEG